MKGNVEHLNIRQMTKIFKGIEVAVNVAHIRFN